VKQLLRVLLALLLLIAVPLYAYAEPEFSFTDLEGNTYTSAGLKGTPLVINIGSHW
jgi:hypothetical protein